MKCSRCKEQIGKYKWIFNTLDENIPFLCENCAKELKLVSED